MSWRVRRQTVFIAFLVMAANVPGSARAQDGAIKNLDDYVVKAMHEWGVPGLAIAVVKGDRVVLAKGYGVRKLGETKPVSEHTLFAIASCSKAFTAAALSMLVDEGKIKWDDPVTKYLPSFQVDDAYVTRELTVRDLLCHRSGLARHDWVWLGSATSRDEVLRRLRHAKPSWSLRSRYGYQNMLYLAAGQIIPAVTGQSWDEFVKLRIFLPLGMTASNTTITALRGVEDTATPHLKIEERITPVTYRNADQVGPAGSINSCVHDMAQWLRLQLSSGTYNNQRLLTTGAIQEMRMPQTAVRREGLMAQLTPEGHLLAYGLGWRLRDYRGRLICEHGGALRGMRSQVSLVPEEQLGVVVLTNLSPDYLQEAIAQRIIDAYLGAPARDWSAEYLSIQKGLDQERKKKEAKEEKERTTGTKPSLALDRYAGVYQSDLYGDLKVMQENGRLVLHLGPDFTAYLEHWQHDTFRATDRLDKEKMLVFFTLSAGGKVGEIKIPDLEGIVARRAADRADAKPPSLSQEDLTKLEGLYVQDPPLVEVRIEMLAGKLKAMQAGQPVTTLVPVSLTRFRLEGGSPGWFLEFELLDGKVKQVILERGEQTKVTLLPKK
jgi:CubicO group peptidase (beta-lactamase class C family)